MTTPSRTQGEVGSLDPEKRNRPMKQEYVRGVRVFGGRVVNTGD